MKIYYKLEHDDEQISNFCVAESVYELCKEPSNDLDAETIAQMILIQVEARTLNEQIHTV